MREHREQDDEGQPHAPIVAEGGPARSVDVTLGVGQVVYIVADGVDASQGGRTVPLRVQDLSEPACDDGAWNGDEEGPDCGATCGVDCTNECIGDLTAQRVNDAVLYYGVWALADPAPLRALDSDFSASCGSGRAESREALYEFRAPEVGNYGFRVVSDPRAPGSDLGPEVTLYVLDDCESDATERGCAVGTTTVVPEVTVALNRDERVTIVVDGEPAEGYIVVVYDAGGDP